MAPSFTSRLLKNCTLLLCLFAPSIWMIANIPPLWRDADAYSQLTLHPLLTTFWGHAPLYSYLAKVPLFLGEQIERWRGLAGAGAESGLPRLTDTGVWLLIIAQHLALGGAAFYFIRSVSRIFWVRLALALVWASNAIFYTYAHCTGSETLSVILMVLLAGKGLRLIRNRRELVCLDWYLFAILLWLCLLTRHANAWTILLLPTTFIISWGQTGLARFSRSSDERHQRRWRRLLAARYLRQAAIALAIGVACMAVANSWTRYVARKTRFHPHSRIGHTLMWRLQFLKALSPPERAALIQKVSDRARSPEARKLLALLRQMNDEESDPVGRSFIHRAATVLFPDKTPPPWERLDEALNQMAYAFLLPPTPEHLRVATTEFRAALAMPGAEISGWLFTTTAYFFEHKDEMPACANLVTFRNNTAEAITRLPSQHSYFHLWRGLSYNKALLIWLASLLLFVVIARAKKFDPGAISAYGIALIATGLLMTASACLLTAFLPRYALPMWQLLLLSLYIFIGASADLLASGGVQARRAISLEPARPRAG